MSNTSRLWYMRLHVSALIGPSSVILRNQVCKCCLHAGIPTVFTNYDSYCEVRVYRSIVYLFVCVFIYGLHYFSPVVFIV